MNPETEKAPEGAQTVESNPESSIPESQGFLDAKEWLGQAAYELEWPEDTREHEWTELAENVREYISHQAWLALVAVHGELNARLVLATKYDTVKGGAK